MVYQTRYHNFHKRLVLSLSSGFSLLELLIVIGIFTILFSISTSVFNSFKIRSDLQVVTNSIVEALRSAQSGAQSGKSDSKWGVKVLSNQVVLFQGNTYATRNSSFDQSFSFPGGISASGLSEVIFEKISGITSNIGDINISNNDSQRVLSVNSKGSINYGDITSIIVVPSYPTPMSKWNFSEGSGCIANDLNGGNNGTLGINCPTTAPSWVVGKIGNALNFNGSTNNISINDSVNLNFTTSMSVSAWIKWNIIPSTGVAYATILNNNGDSQYRLQHNGTNSNFEFGIKTNSGDTYVTSLTSPVAGVWYHLVGTWDGNLIKLYVNGVLEKTGPRTGTIPSSIIPVKIGSSSSSARWFNGIIDEVNLWNQALTQAEVTQVYSSNL